MLSEWAVTTLMDIAVILGVVVMGAAAVAMVSIALNALTDLLDNWRGRLSGRW